MISKDISWLIERPIAHRGLHDVTTGRIENTVGAILAAAEAGYAAELDLQLSGDRVPMVFHDHSMSRLTARSGSIRDWTSEELQCTEIAGSRERIPTLVQLLDAVGGRTALVIEIKGLAGEDAGYCEAVARDLENYGGPVALMSFNHWLLEDMAKLNVGRPLGLTAEGDDRLESTHADIVSKLNLDFVSYNVKDLPCRFVRVFRATGKPVITWTVRSPEQAAHSALYADQITFEGFLPPV